MLTQRAANLFIQSRQAMDSTSKTYRDEKEANKELVSVIKGLGHNAIYEFRMPNGRTADAKVDNVLIEGKLTPNRADEVDRLIGQLQEYCQSKYRVNVVIYGPADKRSLSRIEKEIATRYPHKAFLTYLKTAKRIREFPSFTNG